MTCKFKIKSSTVGHLIVTCTTHSTLKTMRNDDFPDLPRFEGSALTPECVKKINEKLSKILDDEQ